MDSQFTRRKYFSRKEVYKYNIQCYPQLVQEKRTSKCVTDCFICSCVAMCVAHDACRW